MNYPKCENGKEKCKFANLGSSRTLMHSPIQYDSEGKPVGGGNNISTTILGCGHCGKKFVARRKEIEIEQGIPLRWEEL